MISPVAHFDYAVFDHEGHLRLVVEAKKRLGASATWAGEYFRNLLVHGIIPKADFFLFVLPDRFFLWDIHEVDGAYARLPSVNSVEPKYATTATDQLTPYATRMGYTVEDLSGPSFEMLVHAWLEDLVQMELSRKSADPALHWLLDSGLYNAVRGGRVEASIEL